MPLNYAQILDCDSANGLGWRVSLFVSGCSLHCPGCFNQKAWNYEYGKPFGCAAQNKILELLMPDYIRGLSILGGNPTDKENEYELTRFVERVRSYYEDRKDIWIWSGHTLEQLMENKDELIPLCDVLVDGPFIEAKKDLTLPFRGSSNQRIIDIKKSLESGKPVLLDL